MQILVNPRQFLVFLLATLALCACETQPGVPASPSVTIQVPEQVQVVNSPQEVVQAPIPVEILGDHSGHGCESVEPVLNKFPADFGANSFVEEHEGRPTRPFLIAPGSDHRPHAVQKNFLETTPSGLLVLYDTTSDYGWLGELYTIGARTLLTHFGDVTALPVAQYQAGDINKYLGVMYVGSTFDEPIPVAFLDDVLATQLPVMWIYDNIWQLVNRAKDFEGTYGFTLTWFDLSSIPNVLYKNANLTRDASNGSGIVHIQPTKPDVVKTLATAVRADGTKVPWAVRAQNLTFISENPLSYIGPDDRMLAFSDLLFETYAPKTPVRHRALVRLEDVNASHDPGEFRAIVDYLAAEHVPFSMALIPLYVDALGLFNGGVPLTLHWKERPAMLSAIKYATSKGGRIIMHGYTHQLNNTKDPYSGVSADDFEFFVTHIDANNSVIYDGAAPGDSAEWAIGRIQAGLAEIADSGLQPPITFEYPHYAGTSVDSKAIRTVLGQAYHRGLFFGGDLSGVPDPAHSIGMFYPFKVTDVYGWKVIPENIGNYEPKWYNNHPPRLAADLVQSAKNNLVIRDGVASFFFHPYYPLAELKKVVSGIKALGYTFVPGDSL